MKRKALEDSMKIYNQIVDIKTNKIDRDYTICVLADIHNTKYVTLKLWQNLIERVTLEKPDYIVIPGDFIYSADDLLAKKTKAKLDFLLTELSKIAPVYLTFGNHDLKDGKKLKVKDTFRYFEELEKCFDIHLLNNKIAHLGCIDLVGLMPEHNAYYMFYQKEWVSYVISSIRETMKSDKIDDKHFVLLMIHSGELLSILEKYINENIDSSDNVEDLEEIKIFLNYIEAFVTGHIHDGLIPKYWQKWGIVKNDVGISFSEGNIFKGIGGIRKVTRCRGIHNLFNGKLIINGGIRKWAAPNPLFGLIDRGMAKDMTTIKLIKK